MVDQVRRKIIKDASARAGTFAPGTGPKLRTKAIVIRFKANDAPQRTARNELHDGLEISIVTAILIDGEHAALLLRKLDERNCFFESCRKGFVDEHIASRSETLASDWIVRIVWRGNDHKANFFNGEEFIERADDADIGILRGSLVAAALQNRSQPQSGDSANHRRMKGAAGKSKSDETNVDHRSIQEWIIKTSEQRPQTYRGGCSILSHR